jgi:hypothetical protein
MQEELEALLIQNKIHADETHALLEALVIQGAEENMKETNELLETLLKQSVETTKMIEALKECVEAQEATDMSNTNTLIKELKDSIETQQVNVSLNLV